MSRFLCLLIVLPVMRAPAQPQPASSASAAETVAITRFTMDDWVVEQPPGGSVIMDREGLLITDTAGCTVWFKSPLVAPVRIRFQASAPSSGRVSDLNCFWMASDPRHPDDLFFPGHGRTGRFATYDRLQLYYVGYGGNNNTTTRFRRYDGTGARPLAPHHDLRDEAFLLQPDRLYTIELTVTREGQVTYDRDGEIIYRIDDPTPHLRGWFGFRTFNSTIRITTFEVTPLP